MCAVLFPDSSQDGNGIFKRVWCWWGNRPRGKKTFEKSARGRENNKNLKIQKRRTGKFEIPTTTRNLVGRANFPQIEEEEDGCIINIKLDSCRNF